MKSILTLLITILVSLNLSAQTSQSLPPKYSNTSLIVDDAGVLNDTQEEQLSVYINSRQAGAVSIIVLICDITKYGYAIDEYNDLAVAYFNAYGIGLKGANNGILILHDPIHRKFCIATGYGTEGMIPDITARHIYQNCIPYLKANEFEQAYRTAVDGIMLEVQKEAPLAQQQQDVQKKYQEVRKQEIPDSLTLLLLLILGLPGLMILYGRGYLNFIVLWYYRALWIPEKQKKLKTKLTQQEKRIPAISIKRTDLPAWIAPKGDALYQQILEKVVTLKAEIDGLVKGYQSDSLEKDCNRLYEQISVLADGYESDLNALYQQVETIAEEALAQFPHITKLASQIDLATKIYQIHGLTPPRLVVAHQTLILQDLATFLGDLERTLAVKIAENPEELLSYLRELKQSLNHYVDTESTISHAENLWYEVEDCRAKIVGIYKNESYHPCPEIADLLKLQEHLNAVPKRTLVENLDTYPKVADLVKVAKEQLKRCANTIEQHQKQKQKLDRLLLDRSGSEAYQLLLDEYNKIRNGPAGKTLPESLRSQFPELPDCAAFNILLETAVRQNDIHQQVELNQNYTDGSFVKAGKTIEQIDSLLYKASSLAESLHELLVKFEWAKGNYNQSKATVMKILSEIDQTLKHSDVSAQTRNKVINARNTLLELTRQETGTMVNWIDLTTRLTGIQQEVETFNQQIARDISQAESDRQAAERRRQQEEDDRRNSYHSGSSFSTWSSGSSVTDYSSNNDGGSTGGGGAGGDY